MYLTKLELELSRRYVREAILNKQKLHSLVSGLFGLQRKDSETLFCKKICGTKLYIYTYSNQPVKTMNILPGMSLIAQRNISDLLGTVEEGQKLGFQLQTMPFKKVVSEGKKNSRRKALLTTEERLSWLNRKAEQAGFLILNVTENQGEIIHARHSEEKGGELTMKSWCYIGQLQITNKDSFCRSLCNGIGPGKAYGLGMLIISRG